MEYSEMFLNMFAAFEKCTGSGLRVSLLWAPIQTLMPSLSLPGAVLGMRAVAPNKAGGFLAFTEFGFGGGGRQ